MQPAIVIARPTHLAQIEAELYARGFDVSRLKSTGDLLVVDAEHILEQFIIDGMPDRARFETAVIPLIEKSVLDRNKCVIRAYGEMVDVLWQSGQMAAAIKLEMLWNELGSDARFSLLCGYAMGNFYKDAVIGDICDIHAHVFSDMQDIAPVQSSRLSRRAIFRRIEFPPTRREQGSAGHPDHDRPASCDGQPAPVNSKSLPDITRCRPATPCREAPRPFSQTTAQPRR